MIKEGEYKGAGDAKGSDPQRNVYPVPHHNAMYAALEIYKWRVCNLRKMIRTSLLVKTECLHSYLAMTGINPHCKHSIHSLDSTHCDCSGKLSRTHVWADSMKHSLALRTQHRHKCQFILGSCQVALQDSGSVALDMT